MIELGKSHDRPYLHQILLWPPGDIEVQSVGSANYLDISWPKIIEINIVHYNSNKIDRKEKKSLR